MQARVGEWVQFIILRGAQYGHYFARSAIWRAWHPQGVPLLYDAGSASDRL